MMSPYFNYYALRTLESSAMMAMLLFLRNAAYKQRIFIKVFG